MVSVYVGGSHKLIHNRLMGFVRGKGQQLPHLNCPSLWPSPQSEGVLENQPHRCVILVLSWELRPCGRSNSDLSSSSTIRHRHDASEMISYVILFSFF